MAKKIEVGILGATGTVGQRFVQLLEEHLGSSRLARRLRSERRQALCRSDRLAARNADSGRIAEMTVADACRAAAAHLLVDGCAQAGEIEQAFARRGISWSRTPAIFGWPRTCRCWCPRSIRALAAAGRPGRTRLVRGDRHQPNCAAMVMVMPLAAWKSYGVDRVLASTSNPLRAPAIRVPSLDILGNVIPYIGDEEGKFARETVKILGRLSLTRADRALAASRRELPRSGDRRHMVTRASVRATPPLADLAQALDAFPAAAGAEPPLGSRAADPSHRGGRPAAAAPGCDSGARHGDTVGAYALPDPRRPLHRPVAQRDPRRGRRGDLERRADPEREPAVIAMKFGGSSLAATPEIERS